MKITFHKFAVFSMMLLHLCVSQGCHPSKKPSEKPSELEMVTVLVTGSPWDSGKRMEIIMANGDVKTCPQSSDYPIGVNDAAGSYGDNGLQLCGGLDGSSRRSECYKWENGKWTETQTLKRARGYHGASTIGNILWITGGIDNNYGRLASTELVGEDGTVTYGPNLPEPRWGHCQVTYQHSTFIIGGWANGDATNTVLRYGSNINEDPMEVAPMVHARYYHACTIFKSPQHSGRPVMIMAGGYVSGMNTAEILDFTQEGSSWQEIENLPEAMYNGPRMSPTADGDYVLLTYHNSIYTLSTSGSSYQWIKKPNELSISRSGHLQFTVPSSLISC